MTTKATAARASIDERLDKAMERLDDARDELLAKDGVIGVGYGPKEREGKFVDGEVAIVVYVTKKKDVDDLKADDVVPPTIEDVPTDVVEIGSRTSGRQASDDRMWIDYGLLHERNPFKDVNIEPEVDFDLDDVAIVQIDDTFLSGNTIDLAKASKRFLSTHPDIFDFITFFVDTASGLPGQGSFHSGVFNQTTGINYYAGLIDRRTSFGTTKLLAVHAISGLNNYTMLQEGGHMWGAYVRNRDTPTSPRRFDLLISSTGQGMFHWGRFFDDDHSPMDYDGIDWHELGATTFESAAVGDDFFHYCPLDLYLMGLCPDSSVGSFYVIQNPSATSGVITGTKKMLTVQNIIWSEGARNPAYPNTQKLWKDAFVVLTKDTASGRTYAQQVAAFRRRFTWQFYKATRFFGRIDTGLRAFPLPAISGVRVATDDDRVVVGWRTNVPTRGRVNYSTLPTAFQRDRAHADPFATAQEATFGSSHGLRISGLQPNRTYYFEIVAETASGQVARSGVHSFATRVTPDTTKPDISNVFAERLISRRPVFRTVIVSWSTDELSDSRVYYGGTRPPFLQKYDPYPTTNHSFKLPVTTRFIAVQSTDAAGNQTKDTNGGAYYEPEDDVIDAPERRAVRIDELVHAGDIEGAVEETSALTEQLAEDQLTRTLDEVTLPEDDLEAGYAALRELIGAENGGLRIVGRGDDFMELAAEDDPLTRGTYVDLPGEIVREERDTILADLVSRIRPGLSLEVMPEPPGAHYRLKKS